MLTLGLGDDVPSNALIFTALVLVDALICSLNTPLTQVAHSVGNIKYYQIANSSVNILLLPASWLLLHWGCSPTSVFVCTIVFSILNQTVCLHELHKLYEYSSLSYLREVVLPCMLISLIVPVVPAVLHKTMDSSILRLILESIASLFAGLGCVYFIILNNNERTRIRTIIRAKIWKG